MLPGLQHAPVPADITSFPLRRATDGAHSSFLETDVGTAALVLAQHVRSASKDTAALAKTAATLLRDAVQAAVDEPCDHDDGCEVLYGRAGLLYALLFLRVRLREASTVHFDELQNSNEVLQSVSKLTADDNLRELVDDIVTRGEVGAKAYAEEFQERQRVPSLMWRWHGKRYLGGAHGVGEYAHASRVQVSDLSPA